jgi:hypothetical protein
MLKVKEEGKENFHSFNKKATHNSLCDNTTCTKDTEKARIVKLQNTISKSYTIA